MANLYTPDRAAEAAISKNSILLQLTSTYGKANRCIPIVWKRLVYPIIVARTEQQSIPQVNCSEQTLEADLKPIIEEQAQRLYTVRLLIRYDYIRRSVDGRYSAGTRLWKEVDARRMMQALNFAHDRTH